jgi:hypothetical protein
MFGQWEKINNLAFICPDYGKYPMFSTFICCELLED